MLCPGGVRAQRDTCNLGHLLSDVQVGLLPGFNNVKQWEVGGRVELFERMATELDVFDFIKGDLRPELYVVSTGLVEMIRGSCIAPKLAGVWASESIEIPAPPSLVSSFAP